MKIAIVSDWHLGFGAKSKRENDAFIQAKEAMEKAVQENPDFILVPGDLFDSALPSPEVLLQAFQVLSIPRNAPDSKVKLFRERKEVSFKGIPVIATHGTHEFRGKDFKNVLELFEEAGFLFYLHASMIEAIKEGEELALFGLGGVPEKKALDVLRVWNPRPLPEKKNLFFFHQSIKEFLPTEDEMAATISLEELPKGFDFFVNGHLHWFNEIEVGKAKLLIPGSTITTQMKKIEAEKPKGFVVFDTVTTQTKFVKLENQRRLFYHKLLIENLSQQEIEATLKQLIERDLSENTSSLEPMIRIKLTGELKKGLTESNIDLNGFLEEFKDKAIFSVEKELVSKDFKKRIAELRELQKSKASISSLGLRLLEKNLEATPFKNAFDVQRIFELLSKNETEKAMKILLKEKELTAKKPEKESHKTQESGKITDFI
jgi:DNA repair exonuclease SbcCD nuclease subunit